MSANRCRFCGSWFEEAGYAFCPICGRPVVPMAARKPLLRSQMAASADREAAKDRKAAAWTLPIGILLGVAGPLLALKVAGQMKSQVIGFVVLLFIMVAVFGANAKAEEEVRFAAGRVARTALITVAVCIAVTAVLAVVAFVLIFVACVTGGH